jgi:UDP-N-acetylmuramate--alanine ligase
MPMRFICQCSAIPNLCISSSLTIHFEDKLELIPVAFTKESTLVVITPAVPKAHLQWNYFLNNNFEVKKRAEVLGLITKNTFCFAVAGTHGKTTTSSILAHILYQSGVDVTSFLGGIVENYNSNLIGNGTTVSVVEADEFDRSFLHLHPNIACITSMDADHLDIYGDDASIKASFKEFADKVEDKNNLFVFEKFTFPDQKVFTIEFSEKQISGRTVKLMIDYEDVLNADTFVE